MKAKVKISGDPVVRRVYRAGLIFLAVIFLSTAGYMVFTDADFHTSLYMTVITVASVGYREVIELDPRGELFTIFVILAGLISWTYLTVMVITFFVEGEFSRVFRRRRMGKMAEKMKNHYIVCGLGLTGRSAAKEFLDAKKPCIAIERDPRVIEEFLKHHPELPVLEGDATTDEMLIAAGVERAKGLISAMENDSDNLLTVLTARSLNPKLIITARATRTENYNKLKIAGANHVIMPNVVGGARMAATLLRPQVIDFLDVMIRGTGETLQLEQVKIPERSPLAGKSLSEAEIPKKAGALVLAIQRPSGEYIFNPGPGEKLEPGETLIVLGPPSRLSELDLALTSKH